VVHVVPGQKVLPPEPPSPVPPGDSGARPTESREPWRYDVPKSGPAPSTRLPRVHGFRLSNGLPVYLAESHSLPLITAYLTSRTGSAADPRELPGLAAFSSSMLDEGAGRRSAVELANDVAHLGLTLETGSAKEESWVYAESLKEQFRESAALMRDVVLAPTFSDREIERVRSERLAALQRERDEPLTIAYKIMWRELYGQDHPYAHLALGTEEALRRIRKEDLIGMHKQSFSPATSALILSGDLTRAEARRLADEILGDWKGSAEVQRPPPDPAPGQERALVVNRPGSPQTTLLVAQLAAARQNPDFERLQLVNRILGNLFSSRINLSLRQLHGYTYRASSDLAHTRGVGPLYISAPVDAEHTGESVREVLAEVQKLMDSGVTDEELAAAKESIKQSLPARFQTNGSAARAIAGLFILDLPANYYHGLESRLAPITTSGVSDAAKLYLHPGEMKIIAVGDLDRIGRELEAPGLGLTERTTDGLPLRRS
jgi:zinc protease